MAGRARSNALRDELAKRARDTFDPDEGETQPTALDYIAYEVENGQTVKAIAASLADTLHFPCDFGMLMRHLRVEHGEGPTEQAIDAARARASHCYAEESIEILDGHAETSADVSRAQSRARGRQWLAERWNRKAYGQDKGVSVSVSIGSLHLDALRAPLAKPAELAGEVTGSFHEVTHGNSVTQQLLPQPQE